MKQLVNLAASAIVVMAGAANAGALVQVQYSLIVKEPNGKTVESREVTGLIGSAMPSNVSRSKPIRCSLTSHAGTTETVASDFGEGLSIILLPLEDKSGVVATSITVSESTSALKNVVLVKGCAVPIGTQQSSTDADIATLAVGDQRTVKLASGRTVEVKLTALQTLEAAP